MKRMLATLVGLMSAGVAPAATFVVQSGSPAVDIKTSNGSSLQFGSVMIGFFRDYTPAMAASIRSLYCNNNPEFINFINDNFVPIGTPFSDPDYGTQAAANPLAIKPIDAANSTVNGTIENSNWLFADGSVTANSQQDEGLVRGTRIFLMIFTAPTLRHSSEVGLYSATTWVISNSPAVNTLSMTLTQVDTPAEVYLGSVGSLITAPCIPEPTGGLLGLMAGFGILVRRRR